ncbi:MAG: hypothetical protein L6Q60_00595 [Rhodocyclaceae bacterium]|nr:hypothetical protein [Rhodocyclaceae bacterium]
MSKNYSGNSPERSAGPVNSGFTRYRLDARDRIVEVGGDWDRFAIDNGAEELVSGAILGMPLRTFIAGDVTRMFVDALLARVRLTGRPAVIPYRCDSPGVKRFMEMSLESIGAELISEHRCLSEQVMFSPLAYAVVSEPASGGWVRRCSMCNRLTDRSGRSYESDEYPHEAGDTVRVIYHVCPDCQRRVKARLGT